MKHIQFDTLQTKRLTLQIQTPELYRRVFTASDNDEEIKQFLGMLDDAMYQRCRNRYLENMHGNLRPFVIFSLRDRHTGALMGNCSYHTWFPQHSRAEIGYQTVEAYRRQGYMSEAVSAVIRYGFETMQLNRIEACIGPANIASQKLAGSMGFTREGLLREHYCADGVVQDSLIFSLLKREYLIES